MKMKLKLMTVGVLCAFCVSCSKTEDKMVKHLEKVESIMKSNMDDPEKGVKKLIDYFEDKGPEYTAMMTELGLDLAKIEGDGDREKRAKKMKEVLEAPVKNFKGTADKFREKVNGNKEAKSLMEDYRKRGNALTDVDVPYIMPF